MKISEKTEAEILHFLGLVIVLMLSWLAYLYVSLLYQEKDMEIRIERHQQAEKLYYDLAKENKLEEYISNLVKSEELTLNEYFLYVNTMQKIKSEKEEKTTKP